ncbi:MAG: ClpXP protease specificity-enhancing factor SspB [Rickettsiales bacterium]|jgi:hypothetical protein|nr:ClpXP protease specificity-enhancing factor SspB [Rickettsiales bacterium]
MAINYQNLLDSSLRGIVREALIYAQFNRLSDGNHFYITFRTNDAGVVIPDFLRMRYPEMMTIVLQYSYSNLNVSDTEFGVTLSFDGRPAYIRVPFSALVEFKDPFTDFMLQFNGQTATTDDTGNDLELPLAETNSDDGRIISLDEFRKNRAKK